MLVGSTVKIPLYPAVSSLITASAVRSLDGTAASERRLLS